MQFLEKDLEEIIYSTPQELLNKRGLPIKYDKILRKVDLKGYGVADIITIYCTNNQMGMRCIVVTIYELKQNKLNINTLLQVFRYMKAIKHYSDTCNIENTDVYIKGVIIGNSIDENLDFCFSLDQIKNFSAFTYKYSFEGIYFDDVDYTLSGQKFNTPSYCTLKEIVKFSLERNERYFY